MRVETIEFAGKKVTVREKKIKELKELVEKVGKTPEGFAELNSIDGIFDMAQGVLQERLPIVFPELTPEDIEEAYPSEIEELIQRFVDVNFFGIRKVISPLLKLAQG